MPYTQIGINYFGVMKCQGTRAAGIRGDEGGWRGRNDVVRSYSTEDISRAEVYRGSEDTSDCRSRGAANIDNSSERYTYIGRGKNRVLTRGVEPGGRGYPSLRCGW